MRRRICSLLAAPMALTVGACAQSTEVADDFGYAGTGIAVSVAPLDLEGVNDACYSFEIKNGLDQRVVARGSEQDPSGNGVAGQNGDGGPGGLSDREARPLCSSRFGDNGGGISYVAPCDASSPEAAEHTVRLWVNAVCEAGSLDGDTPCVPMYGYQNPCGNNGCVVTANCVEDSDVPVQFNFTIMASAKQGFFDIAVRFDEVFCSAKLDTCYGEGANATPIDLLFDDSGNEVHTAVAAISCTAGVGNVDTTLFYTNVSLNCSTTGTYVLDLSSVDEEGNFEFVNPEGDRINASIYYGSEALPNGTGPNAQDANKVFTNVAFVLPEDETCSFNWLVVPSDEPEPCPSAADGSAGEYSQVAGIEFNVGGLTAGSCDTNPLDEEGSGVNTVYLTTDPPAYTGQLNEGDQAFTDPSCSTSVDPTLPCTGPDTDGDGIPDSCDTCPNGETFSWVNWDTVCPNGTCIDGSVGTVAANYQSDRPVITQPFPMYGQSVFPLSFNLPTIGKAIRNDEITNNTLTFATPVSNPTLVFASIGRAGQVVPVEFDRPVKLIWCQALLNGPTVGSAPLACNGQMVTEIFGQEGYAVVEVPGTHSAIGFNYKVAERWANFHFGMNVCNALP
jgi:hypothetical protein